MSIWYNVIHNYYLGIDGGGSRTISLVADCRGNVATYEAGPGINFYASGIEESRKNLRVVVGKLAQKIDIKRIKRAFIGNSAIDYSINDDAVKAYKNGILDCPLSMRSDAYAALVGHTLGGKGCLVISGTGSVAVSRDAAGQYRQLGGWGHLLGDEGSAYEIAVKGYKAAIHCFDGLGSGILPDTMLAARVMERHGLSEPYELLKVINPGLGKKEIAAFSLDVKECAEAGDNIALGILEEAAIYLAELGAAAAKLAGVSVIGIYGSVLTKDRFVRENFERFFALHVNGGTAVEPQLPPVAGAVLLAMAEDGIAVSGEIIANLKNGIAGIMEHH